MEIFYRNNMVNEPRKCNAPSLPKLQINLHKLIWLYKEIILCLEVCIFSGISRHFAQKKFSGNFLRLYQPVTSDFSL
jgi:hypothetical protein